jgi:F-type H+-transporting ATPase subunit alpha
MLKNVINIDKSNNDIFNIEGIINPDLNDFHNIGIVTNISDGIVSIIGLYDVAFGEMIEILTGTESAQGMVLNIEEDKVSAVIFTTDINIKPGQEVLKKNTLMSVPTGDNLLGRIVDPLGNPLDYNLPINYTNTRFMDSMAPSIIF